MISARVRSTLWFHGMLSAERRDVQAYGVRKAGCHAAEPPFAPPTGRFG